MPKHVTGGGVHLPGLEPGNRVLKKCRSDGEPLLTGSYLTDPVVKRKAFHTGCDVFNYANQPVFA